MRPTHEFKTTGGHTLILNAYITGAENWSIRQIYMRAANAGTDAADTALEAEKKAFNLVIASFDTVTENVADEVLKLPLAEYKEVAEQVTEIVEAKKKLQAS